MSSYDLSSVVLGALPLEVSNSSLDLFAWDDLGFLNFFSRGGTVVRGATTRTLSRDRSSGWLTNIDLEALASSEEHFEGDEA